ncbi:hypothetical protein MLD38_036311 [Melastoma candidum]|uniref:Uncharacterized protein n=1 Tax=Melastoma candidum TaxID=119954 RepID=A0ACB9LJB2_9MYRT|nr:hypothetical protein MLD38_036311 [Melastoma candidum]
MDVSSPRTKKKSLVSRQGVALLSLLWKRVFAQTSVLFGARNHLYGAAQFWHRTSDLGFVFNDSGDFC